MKFGDPCKKFLGQIHSPIVWIKKHATKFPENDLSIDDYIVQLAQMADELVEDAKVWGVWEIGDRELGSSEVGALMKKNYNIRIWYFTMSVDAPYIGFKCMI